MPASQGSTVPRLRADIADFWRFLRHPTLRRLPPRRRGSGPRADWLPPVPLRRLLAWVSMLWAINLFALGPLAVAVATLGGAHHKLEMGAIPWFTAIVWAPVVEEMLFRYSLRRPAQALWVVPLMILPLLRGPNAYTAVIVVLVLGLVAWTQRQGGAARREWKWEWRRRYVRYFPWILHSAALVFAGMHLGNFYLNHTPLWLMPLLVLPQWLTGLVLSWMRTRRGIGASILMHAMFNAGPVLLVLALMKWAPEVVS
ncbi:CPBP family glutamic-type intramembrane protease [Bordetella genomosp. 11]|uniref:CPBP family intramembrane metalloprotease n=1 Tax=Bordetella genomosp. 11 TaxID=1416808 RepID=A0A261UYF2_9BORD|nr:CPBP family glutamic-type intramembrane protease [Bordetella genomosp. 11]OZI66631.1 CPBP family intramembrane metalloprotease [Bordetella genomosp. 11]